MDAIYIINSNTQNLAIQELYHVISGYITICDDEITMITTNGYIGAALMDCHYLRISTDLKINTVAEKLNQFTNINGIPVCVDSNQRWSDLNIHYHSGNDIVLTLTIIDDFSLLL